MLWLFKACCNGGHKQRVAVETSKTKVSKSQQYEWELRTASWKVHMFFPGQKVWNTTCSAKTSAPPAGQQLLQVPWCGVDMDSLPQVSTRRLFMSELSAPERAEAQKLCHWLLREHLDLWVLHLGHWAWETKPKSHQIFTLCLYSPLMWRCPPPPSPFLTPPVCRRDTISLGRTQPKGCFSCHVCFVA